MKRLVFCFDGTWNTLDAPYPTNVVITAESVLPLTQNNVAQVVFYDEGVGTSKYEKVSGGMFGAGLIKNMADGYRFLIFNYTPGDEIYVLASREAPIPHAHSSACFMRRAFPSALLPQRSTAPSNYTGAETRRRPTKTKH